jgi:lipopolysaccharide biosynthesis glycosyltransferase
LPFIYNVTPSAWYSYIPAFVRNADKIAIIHFIGDGKPWRWERCTDGKLKAKKDEEMEARLRGGEAGTSRPTLADYVQRWWDVHDKCVEPWVSECASNNMRLVDRSTHHICSISHWQSTVHFCVK